MIVDDVAVKMAVHPLLQKSAVDIRVRSRSLSSKICTLVLTGGVAKVPVAFEEIMSPLGSPTLRPPPALKFCKIEESEFRKNVFVAPVS